MKKNLEERVEQLEKLVKDLTKNEKFKIRKKLNISDTFKLLDLEWKILDITEKGYCCIASRLENGMEFGKNNNWKESGIREYLNGEFLKELADEIGEENIIMFKRDLLSLDGQTEYGTCEDLVSIISLDEYRKYRKLLPNERYYWWTLTPDSTACNDDQRFIAVVCPSGVILGNSYDCNDGVRPFCIFSPAIFESGDE